MCIKRRKRDGNEEGQNAKQMRRMSAFGSCGFLKERRSVTKRARGRGRKSHTKRVWVTVKMMLHGRSKGDRKDASQKKKDTNEKCRSRKVQGNRGGRHAPRKERGIIWGQTFHEKWEGYEKGDAARK